MRLVIKVFAVLAANLNALAILDGAGQVICGMVLKAGTDEEIQVEDLEQAAA